MTIGSRPTLLPYGPRASLIETDDPRAWATTLRTLIGVIEVVPAARTVLVVHDGRPATIASIEEATERAMVGAVAARSGSVVVIDVVYDGPDLADVAAQVGLSVDEVVDLHTSTVYESAFCGFSPGFAYLERVPDRLQVPRRATPRLRVPTGSVAIAGPYTAVYPSASPGGWNLLGRTTTSVWDVEADPPALLEPGTMVRFRSVGSHAEAGEQP